MAQTSHKYQVRFPESLWSRLQEHVKQRSHAIGYESDVHTALLEMIGKSISEYELEREYENLGLTYRENMQGIRIKRQMEMDDLRNSIAKQKSFVASNESPQADLEKLKDDLLKVAKEREPKIQEKSQAVDDVISVIQEPVSIPLQEKPRYYKTRTEAEISRQTVKNKSKPALPISIDYLKSVEHGKKVVALMLNLQDNRRVLLEHAIRLREQHGDEAIDEAIRQVVEEDELKSFLLDSRHTNSVTRRMTMATRRLKNCDPRDEGFLTEKALGEIKDLKAQFGSKVVNDAITFFGIPGMNQEFLIMALVSK